jgi:hypothetical protein
VLQWALLPELQYLPYLPCQRQAAAGLVQVSECASAPAEQSIVQTISFQR